MVRVALVLLFGCFPGLQESTDKQELRYRFVQGQELEITVGQKMSLKLKEIPEEFAEMIGDEPLKLDFTGTISVTVTALKENGTAILKGKFTKASATGTVFVEDVEFEYDAEKPEEMEEGEEGAGKLGKITSDNIGKRLAIVLDGQVISAPTIRGRVDASGQISGDFTRQEVSSIATFLSGGRLPAEMTLVSRKVTSPKPGLPTPDSGK